MIVSSAAHKGAPVHLDDLQWHARDHIAGLAYAESKSANILFAEEATRRWGEDGIFANAVLPGSALTGLQRFHGEELKRQIGFILPDGTLNPILKTAARSSGDDAVGGDGTRVGRAWRARARRLRGSAPRRPGDTSLDRASTPASPIPRRHGACGALDRPAPRTRRRGVTRQRVTVRPCLGRKSTGCRSRTRSSARGRPWVLTPGGRFSKDYGRPRARDRDRRPRKPRPDLGPPELRRVGGVLPRRIGVRDAGRRAGRPAPSARDDASGHHRWIGRRARVAPDRQPSPRRRPALGVWWISGGVFGLLSLGGYYCAPRCRRCGTAAWRR